jgi:RNA polymerase sigma-70 factor (ECF subfamily)
MNKVNLQSSDSIVRTIEDAAGGDEAAFNELIAIFSNTIQFHCSNLVANKEDTEDAAQEVKLQIFRTIRTLKSPYAFSAWLKRLIVNVCYRYNDKTLRRTDYAKLPLEAASNVADERSDSLPEGYALEQDRNAKLYELIEKLPPVQRSTLIMYYYKGLPQKKIAGILKTTNRTVSSNMWKAKRNLKAMLEREDLGVELSSAAITGALQSGAASSLALAAAKPQSGDDGS